MTPQTETKPLKPVASDVIEQHAIAGLKLCEASRFNHSDSINTQPGTGISVSIVPARITANGDWAPISGEQRADGFGLAQMTATADKGRVLKRGFVSMSNVLEIIYGV